MAAHTLRYTSPAKAYRLTPPFSPYTGKVNHWTLSESIEEHPQEDIRKEGVYEYRIVMERNVATEGDLPSACSEARAIAEELDVAWCYAAARPFVFKRLGWQFFEGPVGWTGNYQEVKKSIRQESQASLFLNFHHRKRSWAIPPYLPLEPALRVRTAYLAADPILRDLIHLHVEAFRLFGQPRFVLLAKALEIAGAYFPACPGTNVRQARNRGLQALATAADLDGTLTQTVEWLFNIANSRREIRHAWNRDAAGLHQPLTTQEGEDFVRNADLVVRAFICSRLSLPIVVYEPR